MFSHYYIHSGIGHGCSTITSFDQALLNTGVGNYNLVRVSSILPAKLIECNNITLPEGSPLHIAYASITASTPKAIISSAISVGIPIDKSKVGVIMEYAAPIKESECIECVESMVKEAMQNRGYEIEQIITTSCETNVLDEGFSTAFSCLAMW